MLSLLSLLACPKVQERVAPGLGAVLPPTCVGNSQCHRPTTVDPVCHPQGKILDTFIARGCDTFGKPLNRIRPRLAFGGKYQTFEWGEIAHYPTFANGAKTPDFVISGLQPKDPSQPAHRLPFISVRWGPAKPFSYDSFLIRWDREDNEKSVAEQHEDEAQQAEAGSGDRGSRSMRVTRDLHHLCRRMRDGFFARVATRVGRFHFRRSIAALDSASSSACNRSGSIQNTGRHFGCTGPRESRLQ